MICITSWITPAILALSLTGHRDVFKLRAAALSQHVPPSLVWAIAFEETRHSTLNIEMSNKGAFGRMQIMPEIWQSHPVCRKWWTYAGNIKCGAYILRYYADMCHNDFVCSAFKYVGGDREYANRVVSRKMMLDSAIGTFAFSY